MGRIHSVESMGLVDGPGIRYVVFFQGCSIRCLYCHNPDTWDLSSGYEISAEDLIKKVLRFKPYFEKSGGGVTISGGEPLMQPDFLIEFLKLCKDNCINTTIDTAGFGIGKYEEILKYTDLVLLDIKHVDNEGYIKITGNNIDRFLEFKEALDKQNSRLWIRHVVIPCITDSKEHIKKLNRIIKQFKNVEKVQLLPYHTLGVNKYKVMNVDYPLKNVKNMSKEKTSELEKLIDITI